MMASRSKAYLYLLSANAIWAVATPILKFTLSGLTPFMFLSYRFIIASIFAGFYFAIKRPKFFQKAKPRDYAILTIWSLISVPLTLTLLFFGLEKSTVLELGLLAAVGPLVVTTGGAIFLKEKIYKNEKIGMFIAFCGVLITVFVPLMLARESLVFTGNLLLLASLLADAAGILIAKKLTSKNYDPVIMVNFAFIIALIVILPLTIFMHGLEPFINTLLNLRLEYHLGALYMALMSGTVAYLFYLKGQKLIEAGEASLFVYLQPVLSWPLAIIWLGEKITMPFAIGAIFITLGVFIAERRTRRQKKLQ